MSDPETGSLEARVTAARAGDPAALEDVVGRIQAPVYRLALRMLWHPEDARDATQEILVRVVTRLATYRGESAFLTWAYRVATNYLLSARRSRLEHARLSFAEFARDLGEPEPGLAVNPTAEDALLLEEVKIGCTHAMLLCLDRPARLAYVIGEILEMTAGEAAAVLDIAPAAFRKRLERARRAITDFMMGHCGLVNPERPCRCRRQAGPAVRAGRVDPVRLLFASDVARARRFPEVLQEIRRLEATRRAAALYRSHRERGPDDLAAAIRQLVAGIDRGRASMRRPGQDPPGPASRASGSER